MRSNPGATPPLRGVPYRLEVRWFDVSPRARAVNDERGRVRHVLRRSIGAIETTSTVRAGARPQGACTRPPRSDTMHRGGIAALVDAARRSLVAPARSGMGHARALATDASARCWGRSRREKNAGARVRSHILVAKCTSYGFLVSNGVYTNFQWANSQATI